MLSDVYTCHIKGNERIKIEKMGCFCSKLPDDADYYYECSAICFTCGNGIPNNIGCRGMLLLWTDRLSYYTCCCSVLNTSFHVIQDCKAVTQIEHDNLRHLFSRNGMDVSHFIRIDIKHTNSTTNVAYIALKDQERTQECVHKINLSVKE